MVGHILRYHPAILKLQKLIQDGALGKINYLYSNRLNIGKIRTEENILWSFAPHDISVMLALLNEMPTRVSCQGGAYLNHDVADVTLSHFDFPSGVQAHIFVSWLHPFKEQRLVVVGSEKMAVFDDTAEHKLVLYPHKVEWRNRIPTAVKAERAKSSSLEDGEPLRAECQHFLDCLESRTSAGDRRRGRPSGTSGSGRLPARPWRTERSTGSRPTRVRLKQRAAILRARIRVRGRGRGGGRRDEDLALFARHERRADRAERCVIGQNVNVDGGTVIGNNVKIQNNVSVYTGAVIEDDVFLGPSCVLTNVTNPRSQVNRHSLYETTRLEAGVHHRRQCHDCLRRDDRPLRVRRGRRRW